MTPPLAADPHRDIRMADIGAPLGRAKAAVVMDHGRGAEASDMLSLARLLDRPDLAYLAPDGRAFCSVSHASLGTLAFALPSVRRRKPRGR